MNKKTVILKTKEIQNLIDNITEKIINDNFELKSLGFIGILTRGVYIANRIISKIKKIKKIDIPLGTLDITFYRDDINSIDKQPIAKETNIPFDINNKNIILVDDVLYTGRSIRCALDAIMDLGRPLKILLAVLIDRGHREIPIQPDYCGKKIQTFYTDEIQVKLREIDKNDQILLIKK